jgi:hypothetical protein
MNTNKDVLKNKWDQFLWKVLNWRNKHRNVQYIKVNSLRGRSMGTLQRCYGYTGASHIPERVCRTQ